MNTHLLRCTNFRAIGLIVAICLSLLLVGILHAEASREERPARELAESREASEPGQQGNEQDEADDAGNELLQEVVEVESEEVCACETECAQAFTFAETVPTPRDKSMKPGLQITLHELGLIQLAAHDLFNVDRETEIDSENGDLDLSTLLDHGEEFIVLGGEPRNRENIFIFSVSKELGEKYMYYLKRGKTEEEARLALVKHYHRELKKVYKKVFGENFPAPQAGEVTMTENVALRTIHDFLPGTLRFNGQTMLTVDMALFGHSLSHHELKQLTSPIDGHFDEEFLDVVIFIPPDRIMHINLQERDSSFATQFNAEHSFEHFMAELEDGSYDSDEDVMYSIRNLFAKGLYFDL